ncbi:MAG: hypothetical protein KDK33_10075 [Leptospiraceae bacterium]|nr:hypothetical protein [Leptospiraceae bacterium]
MEIIYFVFLVFNRGALEQAHIQAWHTYSAGPKYLIDRPCEETIKDPSFQKHLKAKLSGDQKGRLLCKSASEMESFRALITDPGVDISSEASIQPGTIVPLEGKLIHKPFNSKKMGRDSYLGQEFFLINSDGTKLALYPTESVSREQLLAKKGQIVKVEGKFVDRTPDPDAQPAMQYPMGPDGGPLKRQGYEVLRFIP